MIIILFAILLFLAILLVKKQYGWLAGFVLVYYRILTTVFFVEGRESLNSLVLFLLYLIILVCHFFTTRIKPLKYYQSPVFLSMIFMVLIMYLHNTLSPFSYYSLHPVDISDAQTSFMINVIFPFVMLPFFIQGSKEMRSFSNSLIFWGLMYFLLILFIFGFNPEILLARELMQEQTDELVGTIYLSQFAAITVLTLSIRLLMTDTKRKYLLGIVLVFSVVVMLVAGQRGTFIGTILALMALIVRKSYRKYVLMLFPLLLFIVFVASFFELEMFERFQQFEDPESFNRYYDYPAVWNIFSDNYFFWGLGTNGYLYKTGRIYPHNLILDSIASFGLLGLMCILILLVFCCKYVLYILKNSTNYTDVIISCCWMMLCFSAMVSGSFASHRPLFVFSGLLVISYSENTKLRRKSTV